MRKTYWFYFVDWMEIYLFGIGQIQPWSVNQPDKHITFYSGQRCENGCGSVILGKNGIYISYLFVTAKLTSQLEEKPTLINNQLFNVICCLSYSSSFCKLFFSMQSFGDYHCWVEFCVHTLFIIWIPFKQLIWLTFCHKAVFVFYHIDLFCFSPDCVKILALKRQTNNLAQSWQQILSVN